MLRVGAVLGGLGAWFLCTGRAGVCSLFVASCGLQGATARYAGACDCGALEACVQPLGVISSARCGTLEAWRWPSSHVCANGARLRGSRGLALAFLSCVC